MSSCLDIWLRTTPIRTAQTDFWRRPDRYLTGAEKRNIKKHYITTVWREMTRQRFQVMVYIAERTSKTEIPYPKGVLSFVVEFAGHDGE